MNDLLFTATNTTTKQGPPMRLSLQSEPGVATTPSIAVQPHRGDTPRVAAKAGVSYKTGRLWKTTSTAAAAYNDTAPNAMDLAVIRNRNYLDPQRFFKSQDRRTAANGAAHMGTVVMDPRSDYGRQSRRERGGAHSLTQQVQADARIRTYTLQKYKTM